MQLKFLPSFVKRKGRITKKQIQSLSSLSEFSVKSIQEVEDFSKHFDKCYLEIGFGNAENIIFQAIKYMSQHIQTVCTITLGECMKAQELPAS